MTCERIRRSAGCAAEICSTVVVVCLKVVNENKKPTIIQEKKTIQQASIKQQ